MAPKSFLWVNKNSKSESLSNSKGDPRSLLQIQQHAGKNATRKRKRRVTSRSVALTDLEQIYESLDSTYTPLITPHDAPAAGKHGQSPAPITFIHENAVLTSHRHSWHTDSNPARHSHERTQLTPTASLSTPRRIIDPVKEIIAQSRLASPPLSISSLPNPLIKLTPRKHRVLQYYISVWMPTSLGRGTATGFTALSTSETAYSTSVVQSTLQNPDPFALYALLTMVSQRMHLVGNLAPLDSSPEYFAVKSIQSLRSSVSRPFSEALVLALSHLILGEAFIKRQGSNPAVSVLRGMNRDLVVQAGGLQRLSGITAQIAVAYDLYAAQGMLTLPYFDVYQTPELLRIDGDSMPSNPAESRQIIHQALVMLPLQLRILLEACHDLSEVIKGIGRLDSSAIRAVCDLTWRHVPQKLAMNAATFQRLDSTPLADADAEVDVTVLDALWMRVRQRAYCVWVWYSAVGLSASPSTSNAAVSGSNLTDPPACVVIALAQTWRHLDQVQSQLEDSGWQLRTNVVLWICAVCLLVATSEDEETAYRDRFDRAARKLDINDSEDLLTVLGKMLPLEQVGMHGKIMEWLWAEIMLTRGRKNGKEESASPRDERVKKEEVLGRAIIAGRSREEICHAMTAENQCERQLSI